MRKHLAFTLIELLVVIAIIAILVGILIPALGAATRLANKVKDQTQIKAIDQALFGWAGKQKTNDFPPVKIGNPNIYGGTATGVFHELISSDGNCKPDGHNPDSIRDDIFVSPVARGYISPHFLYVGSGGPDYYGISYGFLNSQTLNKPQSMGEQEWKNNGSHQVPLVANRFEPAAGDARPDWPQSDYSGLPGNPLPWCGNIGWGDGHVNFNTLKGADAKTYVRTFMSGKMYTKDYIWDYDVATGPNGDAIFGIPVYNLGEQKFDY